MSSSIESNLESVAPEEDIAVLLRWCQSIGLETILDIAGLREHELLGLCPDHLKDKLTPFHRMACRLKQDKIDTLAVSRLRALLPEKYAFVPPELLHKSHMRGKPKAQGVEVDNADREKSLKVATSLLMMMAAKSPSSPLAVEWESSRLKSAAHGRAWQEAMAGAIADSASLASLRSALGEWQRLTCFLDDNQPPIKNVEDMQALDLYRFLKGRTAQGPTAASGAWRSLSWTQSNLKVDMHTDNVLVKHFSASRGHDQSQAEVIPLYVMQAICAHAELLQPNRSAATPLVVACCLVLRVLILGIRFEHASRASRLQGCVAVQQGQGWPAFQAAPAHSHQIGHASHGESPEVPRDPTGPEIRQHLSP